MPYLRENQVSKLRTLEEIEKASDDFHPRMDMDPIMDILKEADEKLITVKSTKKEGKKGKHKTVNAYVLMFCRYTLCTIKSTTVRS